MTHTYQLEGMTCNSCVARIKSELLKTGDITNAELSLHPPQAVISMSRHIPIKTLQEIVKKAGNYGIKEAGESHQPAAAVASFDESLNESSNESYLPIIILFSYITLFSMLPQLHNQSFDWMQWMSHFMGGFFISFSFFKLINLRGFSDGYRTYDLLAKKFPAWGYIYPFVELCLGIAFLTGFYPLGTNIVTLIVMGISSIGVINSLLKKQKIQCACLGTVIKLPLGKVSLAEDILMVVMSAFMLFMIF